MVVALGVSCSKQRRIREGIGEELVSLYPASKGEGRGGLEIFFRSRSCLFMLFQTDMSSSNPGKVQ